MRSKYELKQIIYVPFEIYAISEILRGDEESLLYQVRGTQDKGITLTMTEDFIEKYSETVPVRHGKWIYGESESGQDGYYCSHCMGHVRWYGKAGGQSIDFISDYHYCPNCGARMDAE